MILLVLGFGLLFLRFAVFVYFVFLFVCRDLFAGFAFGFSFGVWVILVPCLVWFGLLCWLGVVCFRAVLW